MTALLALLVIGAAIWFGLPLIGVRPRVGRDGQDTIAEFSRAMTALNPTAPVSRGQRPASRPQRPLPRPAAGRR